MASPTIYEHTVDVLRTAYFHNVAPMRAISEQYTTLRDDLVQAGKGTPVSDPRRKVVNMLMCFIRSMLVNEYSLLTGDNHSLSNALCYIDKFDKYTDLTTPRDQYIRWTHIVLSTVAYLRLRSLPVRLGETELTNEFLSVDVAKKCSYVFDNARLLFYGILLARLCSIMFREQRNSHNRYNIEACLFMTVVSFYSDFVQIQKATGTVDYVGDATFEKWKVLYDQVNTMYVASNSAFFTLLKLGNPDVTASGSGNVPLKAFLSPDTVETAKNCIVSTFLHRYNKTVLAQYGSFEVQPVLKCLNNMQAFRYRMTRWFRNKILNTIKDAGLMVQHVAGKTYQLSKYVALFATEYPVASVSGAVAFAIVAYAVSGSIASAPSTLAKAFGNVILSTSPYTIVTLGATATVGAAVRKAWILVFTDPELQKAPGFRKTVINETASEPPFLQQVTSPDGVINTIYRVAPLPVSSWLVAQQGWSMETPTQNGGDGIRVARDVQQLKDNFRQGYIRDELPPEMQRYIRDKLKLNTSPRRGGAAKQEIDDKYSRDIDKAYTVTRLKEPVPADPVVLSKEANDDNFRLWIPMTSLQSASLEANFNVDTPDPGSEVSTLPSKDALPDVTPASNIGHIMTKEEVLSKARQTGIPAPPVLPDSTNILTASTSLSYHPYTSGRSKPRKRTRRKSSLFRRRTSRRRIRSQSRSRSRTKKRSKPRKPRKRSGSRSRSRLRYGSYR